MTNDPIKTLAKDLHDHFSREDVHMANKHMNIHRISSVIRKLQIKTIEMLLHTPQNGRNQGTEKKCWQACARIGTLVCFLRRKYCSCCENQFGSSSRVKCGITPRLSNLTLWYLP